MDEINYRSRKSEKKDPRRNENTNERQKRMKKVGHKISGLIKSEKAKG